MAKVLFIARNSKHRYGEYSKNSIGLTNSATFVVNKLNQIGHEARFVIVHDNNYVDRVVSEYRPDFVVIEALWLTPQKLNELLRIHRHPVWLFRIHSKAPFLAMEGMAIEWICRYNELRDLYGNVDISCNNQQFNDELNSTLGLSSVYLPNMYFPSFPKQHHTPIYDCGHRDINIGCFGAVRGLKNQLLQAMAAIMFGNRIGRRICFHMHTTRQEQGGDAVYKNIEALFNNTEHKLVTNEWYSHHEFVTKLLPKMDLCLQVSLSESFNIVTSDCIYAGIPCVVSEEIDWASQFMKVNPNSAHAIATKLNQFWHLRLNYPNYLAEAALQGYNKYAIRNWLKYLQLN